MIFDNIKLKRKKKERKKNRPSGIVDSVKDGNEQTCLDITLTM
jgi:hypothetical protein